jgi:hypothetical protein
MFVSGSKYRTLEFKLLAAELQVQDLQQRLNAKIEEWNELVGRINRRGGESFLTYGVTIDKIPAPQFTPDELKTLLLLCHPDKHGGKDSAVRITQKLLELR